MVNPKPTDFMPVRKGTGAAVRTGLKRPILDFDGDGRMHMGLPDDERRPNFFRHTLTSRHVTRKGRLGATTLDLSEDSDGDASSTPIDPLVRSHR